MAWLKIKREERDSKKNRARHAKVTSSRLSQVFASTNGVEDADPEEVEARIRNMFYGSSRKSSSDPSADAQTEGVVL